MVSNDLREVCNRKAHQSHKTLAVEPLRASESLISKDLRKEKFEVQQTIDRYDLTPKLLALDYKLDRCSQDLYRSFVCGDCGAVIVQQAYKLSCGSRICPYCVEERVKMARIILGSYKIYANRLLHFYIGFEPVKELHDAKKEQEKILRVFYREMAKLGTPVRSVRTFDINKTNKGLRYHYHHAQLPTDAHLFTINCQKARKQILKKTGIKFIVEVIGYRPKRTLFFYFAKCMAGLYSDEKRHHKVLLRELITKEQYITSFRHSRSFALIGLARVKRGKVNINWISKPKFCPVCNSTNIWSLTFDEYVDYFGDIPPPPLDKPDPVENTEKLLRRITPYDPLDWCLTTDGREVLYKEGKIYRYL